MKRSMVVAAALLASSSAYAHFKINSPASMTMQSANGSPSKSAPCGLSDTAGMDDTSTKTNQVTVLQEGTMLAIKLNETIFHPGHYRVAIAQDMAGLPVDPPVTAGGNPVTACGSTTIAATPTMPVLGDGLLVHTTEFGVANEQTMQVQLPAGFTCTNCVLQVTQFMSNHGLNNPGGCFYHHCSTVTIQTGAPPVDGPPTTNPGVDGGTDPSGEVDDRLEGGCCSANGGPTTGLLGAALMALLVLRKRRR